VSGAGAGAGAGAGEGDVVIVRQHIALAATLGSSVASDARPTLWQLFTAFLERTLSGFGGVLAWSHRTLVERRGWVAEREFAALLGLAQVLPGGNIINVAVILGDRFQGLRGVLVCLAGLLGAPFILVLLVGNIVSSPAFDQVTGPALRGASSVVAGMVLATGLKMARPYRGLPRTWLIAGLTLAAIGLLQLPLLLVLAVVGPLSVVLAWRSEG
jgi:chromate transporter